MIRNYPVTSGLILMNLLIFISFSWQQETVMFSDAEDFLILFQAGANFNPFTLDGEPWRIITSMFMHANIIHLFANMFGLYQIGRLLEDDLGSLRLLLVYMITGIFGGVASLVFNLFVFSVGASGAVFGLYGYYIVNELLVHYRDRSALINIVTSFAVFVVINYFIAISMPVDTAAHIGGVVSGAVLATTARFRRRYFSPVLLSVILLSAASTLLVLPKDQVQYYAIFRQVMDTEDHQRKLYDQQLPDQQVADSLTIVLHQWDSIRSQLQALQHVPRGLRYDTAVLSTYLQLRRVETRYRLTGIEKESYVYLDSLGIIYHKLDSVPKLEHNLDYRIHHSADNPPEDPAAPSLEAVTVYYDSNWVETEADNAVYHRVGHRDSLNRWQGDVRDYYRDGAIQMKGKYRDDMNHGVFIYYSPEGKYESAGRYEKENPAGKWEYFYPTGKLHREVVYAGRAYTKNVYDTLGNLQVENGNGRQVTWYSNGVIEEEGQFVNGWCQGTWRGYHRNGKPYFEEYYRDNLLVKGMAIDTAGNRYIYDQSSLYPSPVPGWTAYRKYLRDNLKRPVILKRKSGSVKLVFTVDEDATIRDFVILESLGAPYDQEAIRLVNEGPRWRPALLRGHVKIQSKSYVEVAF
jgi:membrane associated rhomboid family serine protease/antitoxin component YwqK of YwqJK toxin-antitoxin module